MASKILKIGSPATSRLVVSVRVYLKTLGCKVNQVESELLAAHLQSEGYALTADESEAEVVFVNTCTVTGEADAKARKAIRRAAAFPQVKRVVVTGCAAALWADRLAELDPKVRVEPDKTKLGATTAHSTLSFQTRVPVKIQDGCENFCSYCIVPYARGKNRSIPAAELREQVRMLVERDTQEVVLTGINLGNYQDSKTGMDLPELIASLKAETGIHRIRLSSIEPPDVTPGLCDLLERGDTLCEHLHLPLQSGSDAVLETMNRHYSTSEFSTRVMSLRKAAPTLALTTDIIVGYPTESDEDFEYTLALCRELAFAKLHVFRFSPRQGTPAAELMPLDPRLVAQRAQRLRALSQELSAAFIASAAKRSLECVVERIDATAQVATLTSREHITLTVPVSGAYRRGSLCVLTPREQQTALSCGI